MGILFSLLAALCYGASDFVAGVGGRRSDPTAVAVTAQPFGLVAAVVAVVVLPAEAPSPHALWWGAVSGVGSGIGTASLYRGLAVARMSVVAPLSAVLSAALPALAGLLLGQRLSALGWTGIALALPAIGLVSVQRADRHGSRRARVVTGAVAGAGFAVLFIALERAGTAAEAWPLVPGQVVAAVSVLAWAAAARGRGRAGIARQPARSVDRTARRTACRTAVLAGVLGGLANLLYLAATGRGQLAVVAVVTALYPALTVVLARVALQERWSGLQRVGLVAAAVAVAAINAS